MKRYLGIDPGQRHTGLCSLEEGREPVFHQIDTVDLPMLESARFIQQELRVWIQLTGGSQSVAMCTMERQLSVGGQSSSLMFYMQMSILEVIQPVFANKPTERSSRLSMPLPVQLASYMKKVHKVDTTSASSIVKCFTEHTKWPGRISQHKVDAYYLARLGKEIHEGKWHYNMPSREAPLFKGTINNGNSLLNSRQDS